MTASSFTGMLTLTTAGTAQPLAVRGTDDLMESIHLFDCASVTITLISPSDATVFIGTQPPKGYSLAVDSTHFNYQCVGPDASITVGQGEDDWNKLDLSLIYAVSDKNNTVIAIAPREV